MILIVGLGNPGPKYLQTRHNVGFMMLDTLVGSGKWARSKSGLLEEVWLTIASYDTHCIKPQTFMNRSGEAVAYAAKKYPKFNIADQLLVIHDDLDIPFGQSKLQFARGPKQHNGLASIESILKTEQFWRLRIGVENRPASEHRIPGQAYVLQPFASDEKEILDQSLAIAQEKIVHWMKHHD